MKMKLSLALNILLFAGLIGMGYTFLIKGKTIVSVDGRTAVLLSEGERNKVLGEMRGLLETVREITVAALDEDYDTIVALATASGMQAAGGESAEMIAKLPFEFKKLGFGLHGSFDELARNVTDMQDRDLALRQLSDIVLTCTTCHAAYRLDVETE